jgi:hypothetical protein
MVINSLQQAAERGDSSGIVANIHLAGRIVDNRSAMMLAAAQNHSECVRQLLELECNLSGRDGVTALVFAGARPPL